jgi:SAM-dependent methyltransferase
MTTAKDTYFPDDVFDQREFPGRAGELLRQVRPLSMFPPYPWGPWLYTRLFEERCSRLEGDIVEAGVGMGGLSLFLAMLVKDAGAQRTVFAVDSYEGLPEPDARKDNPYFVKGEYGPTPNRDDPLVALLGGRENALLESLKLSARAFGVDDIVVPVQGFFEDALRQLDADCRFCFVHIDADLYSSVLCALEQLYDRVVPGGVIAIDDFFHPVQGPVRAAAEFFNSRGITPLYHVVFPYSVFLIKEDHGPVMRSVDGNAYSLDCLRDDDFLLQTLERSLERADGRPAGENCARLLDALQADEPYPGEIYDYWRSLEDFWTRIERPPGG